MPAETIATSGGHALAAQFFFPSGPGRNKGAVLIVPAMGVTQEFYAPLATWLAGQGFVAATFDYQGIGRSRTGPLREVRANVLDWATVDCAAMMDALAARAPGLPLSWIGHSLGGQITPFVPNRERLTKIVTVATGTGYWRENALRLRWRVWLLWYLLAPLAVWLLGYFPGRRLGMVGDLPGPVMRQWRRWCLARRYFLGDEGVAERFASVRTPLLALSFTDDQFLSARNVSALHAAFTRAPKVMIRIAPRDVGERRIGHFGFFRPRAEAPLWRPFLLPALLPAPAPAPAAPPPSRPAPGG
jgi:predicted alpha/beta hydrolase